MGQSPSTLLASHLSSEYYESDILARDILGPLTLLAELKLDGFFGDVQYESSIEGDMLLPLDKVVTKGWKMYCDATTAVDGDGGVGEEIEGLVGEVLRAEVIEALTITIRQVLASARDEANGARKNAPRAGAERRGFVIAVGHLGGIYRLNYLLHAQTLHSNAAAKALTETTYTRDLNANGEVVGPTFLTAVWALSSVRLDWLPLNAVNIAIEQSFLHARGESHADFRKRMQGVKELVLKDWEEDHVREAGVERRKRRIGSGFGDGIEQADSGSGVEKAGGMERPSKVRFEGEGTRSEGQVKGGEPDFASVAGAGKDGAQGLGSTEKTPGLVPDGGRGFPNGEVPIR